MSSQDWFYYSVSLGFLVLVGVISYVSYHIVQTLNRLKIVLEDAEDITQDVTAIKNNIKLGIVQFLGMFLAKRR